MKTLLIISTLLFAVLAAGCSSSYVVSSSAGDDFTSISDFNAFTLNKKGLINFEKDILPFEAIGIKYISDSLFWLGKSGLEGVAIDQIKEVAFENTSFNTWIGVGLGLVGGAAVGGIVAVLTTRDPSRGTGIGYISYLIEPVIGGIIGALIGGINGSTNGHTYRYTFQKVVR